MKQFTTIFFLFFNLQLFAQFPGALDTTFQTGTGANDYVQALTIQADGKILIGGNFSTYNGIARSDAARVNDDGSLDTSFNPGTGGNGALWTMPVQSDGKIIIGGNFSTFNGATRRYITRLHANGSLDTSFNIGTGGTATVMSSAIQSDGKIIISGVFTSVNSTPLSHVARLNPDRSIDTSFQPGSGANDFVYTVALQTDGKIIVGGAFTTFNGWPRSGIARLNANGSLDSTFNPGSGVTLPGFRVYTSVIQTDGKIIIGGIFTAYNGTARKHVARINTDGSLDFSFNPGTGPDNQLLSIALQNDGEIFIGGVFKNYNGKSRNYIARLHTDGTLDTTFNPGPGPNGVVRIIALQSDNAKIIIGGDFTAVNGDSIKRLARLLNYSIIEHISRQSSSINFTIYPDPARDKITVLFAGLLPLRLDIVNIMGATVFRSELQNSKTELDISSLSKGIYFIRAEAGGNSFSKKLVIQ